MPLITLLTDFGLRDYYVAAVKGVLLSRVADCRLVDLSHDVAPGDLVAAQFLLAAAAPEYPDGTIHLVVVDPGVGSDRRILAARASGACYVAPDNGVLTPVLEEAEVHAVERPDLYRAGRGETFHGRDRFAPVAAAVASGARITELGPPVTDVLRLDIPEPRREAGLLSGVVRHVDRFGNLVTDIPSHWCTEAGWWIAHVSGHEARRLVTHYAELEAGEPGFLPGSLGTIEISLRGASLAAAWNVDRGEVVEIRAR